MMPCAPFEVTGGLRRPSLQRQTQEGSLTPEGLSYRSEDGAIEAKPRTPHATTACGAPEKSEEKRDSSFTAQTAFGMTKFFRQLVVAADFVDDFGDDGFV